MGIEEAHALGPWRHNLVAEDVPGAVAGMELIMSGKESHAEYVYRMADASGRTKYFKVFASEVAYDNQLAVMETLFDVTEYAHAAERQLAAIAHELRTPLNIVRLTASVLERIDPSDPKFMKLLNRIAPNAERMAETIETLMALARAEHDINKEHVNLTKMAYMTMERLMQQDPKRNVQYSIQDGVEASGDKSLLGVVLTNLLGNAWKYTSRITDGPALIEFGCRPYNGNDTSHSGDWAYFVRDNGAGFDPATAQNLFGFGQRLHSEQQFKGNGIGLNTVKKIIECHGGKIWAEGAVGKGATFYFTLPLGQS